MQCLQPSTLSKKQPCLRAEVEGGLSRHNYNSEECSFMHTDRQAECSFIATARQACRQKGLQADKQADIQTDRQTDS